jgi:hypothetical protein
MSTTFAPTPEQEAILTAALTRRSVAITAGAGTGKTSTLRLIAEQTPNLRWLYIAYNKSVQVKAQADMPSNVVSKTAHALAYAKFGAPMRHRLNGPRRTGQQNAEALGITKAIGFYNSDVKIGPVQLATKAIEMVFKFCRSADREIGEHHFVTPEGCSEGETVTLARLILPFARKAWADMISPRGSLKPTHDVYLKQWALSNPVLNFDGIFYDEAQDADPCIAGVVESQRCQIIAVGDSSQAIYGWRGAGDFLERMRAEHRLALTQSWRFGPGVADEANVWLGVVGTKLRVTGSPHRTSTIGMVEKPDAILCRTNAGTIEQLMEAHTAGIKVHLVGDGKEMVALARAAQRMMNGQRPDHPELVAFRTWDQVVHYSENDPSGSDLAIAVRMIETYGADAVIEAIDKAVPAAQADLVVSTAHKAKGMEWPKVRIGGDFKEPLEKETGKPLPITKEEAMLAYVAVTRAMEQLDNGGLAWVHAHLQQLGQ